MVLLSQADVFSSLSVTKYSEQSFVQLFLPLVRSLDVLIYFPSSFTILYKNLCVSCFSKEM
jgi:hypothetical protein